MARKKGGQKAAEQPTEANNEEAPSSPVQAKVDDRDTSPPRKKAAKAKKAAEPPAEADDHAADPTSAQAKGADRAPSPSSKKAAKSKKDQQPPEQRAQSPPSSEAPPPTAPEAPKPASKSKGAKQPADRAPKKPPVPDASPEPVPQPAPQAADPAPTPAPASASKAKVKASLSISDHPSVSKVLRFNYPIYAVSWTLSEKLLIGGGGGQKYGMPNHLVCGSFKKSKSGCGFFPLLEYDSGSAIIWSMGNVHWATKMLVIGHTDSVSLLRLDFGTNSIQKCCTLPVMSKSQQESRKYSAVSPCGRLVIIAQDDCRLACAQVADQRLTIRPEYLSGHQDRITDISVIAYPKPLFPPSLKAVKGGVGPKAFVLVATASEDATLRVWRVSIVPEKGVKSVVPMGSITTRDVRRDKCLFKFCRLDPRGLLFALSTGMGSASFLTVFQLKLQEGAEGCEFVKQAHQHVTTDSVTAFSMSANGQLVACGDNEGGISVLRASDLKQLLRRKDVHDCPVTSLDISPTNEWLVSADLDAVVKIYPARPEALWRRPTVLAAAAAAAVFALLAVVALLLR